MVGHFATRLFETIILVLAEIANDTNALSQLKRLVYPALQKTLDGLYGQGVKDAAWSFDLIPFVAGTALVLVNEAVLHAGPGIRFCKNGTEPAHGTRHLERITVTAASKSPVMEYHIIDTGARPSKELEAHWQDLGPA